MPELMQIESAAFSREQYRALLEVADAISVQRDLGELFDDLARRLPSIVPLDFINLVLHDPVRNVMRLHLLNAPETATIAPGMELPVEGSPGGLVWATQEPVVVEDVALDDRFPLLSPLLRENDVQSFCVVPLTTALRQLGAMGFGSLQRRNYGAGEIHFMQQVAKQVAVAVDNVLHDESAAAAQRQLARERDRMRLLLEVNNAVVFHLSLDALFPAVSGCLRKVIEHDGSALVLWDPETSRYRVHVLSFANNESFVLEGTADPKDKTPAKTAISTRQVVLLDERDLHMLVPDSDCAKYWVSQEMRAFCSMPLIFHDRVLGTLDIGRRRESSFSLEEVELLGEVAKQIAIAVENARAYRQISELKDKLAKEKLYLEEEISTEHNFGEIVGESKSLVRVLKQVETVASTDSTVLICGETGTGKELIARAVHQLSPRRERTFVKLNCAAIPTGLLESELFGHEKGAFTGAIAQKIGRFELAHQGTLFLDEVGDIPPELQPKLLRVLQEQEFERLGSTRTIQVNVRLLAATNRDLGAMAADGRFRSDLYYRLNVFPVALPPLRERPDDIPRLVRHFSHKLARRMGRRVETIPAETMEALVQYRWPGNVRELENVIERAVILSPGSTLEVSLADLKRSVSLAENNGGPAVTLDEAERAHILSALEAAQWVLGGPSGAAARLAMKRTTLQSKMKKLRISRPR